MRKILFILFLFAFIGLASASDIPKIIPYVNDFANILTPEEELKLNLLCDGIENSTTFEIAIVTVQNTGGMDSIEFANKIGDENGVGKKDKDNGIVVLWSMEDGGAIATGRFAESIFNDAKVVRIGKAARPYFDNQSYYLAFEHIIIDMSNDINASISSNQSTSENSDGGDNSSFLLLLLIIGGIIIFFWVLDGGDGLGSVVGGVAGAVISGGKKSGGSSFGSGRSFGGGSFGGAGGKF